MVKGLLCGILHIHVETCYENELLSKGTCVFCSRSSVEDEKHFLLLCQIYDNVRMIIQIIMIRVNCINR